MTHSYQADVTDDGLVFEDSDAMNRGLQDLMGQRITVTFTPKATKRSQKQNNWIWGRAYPIIAEHLGYDRHEHERLHYDLLSVRFGTKAVPPLMEGAPPRIVPTRTSSDMTTAEFSDYMDWVVRFAAEKWDVYIPLPDDPDA